MIREYSVKTPSPTIISARTRKITLYPIALRGGVAVLTTCFLSRIHDAYHLSFIHRPLPSAVIPAGSLPDLAVPKPARGCR